MRHETEFQEVLKKQLLRFAPSREGTGPDLVTSLDKKLFGISVHTIPVSLNI